MDESLQEKLQIQLNDHGLLFQLNYLMKSAKQLFLVKGAVPYDILNDLSRHF